MLYFHAIIEADINEGDILFIIIRSTCCGVCFLHRIFFRWP